MTDHHPIRSASLSATIRAQGGELVELSDAGGPALWHGGPDWPRHSPVLFPIVGRLKDDRLTHKGRSYRLTQHGFARDSLFDWVERSESRAVLRLTQNEATLAIYPFRFTLEMIYAVENDTLSATARVTNPGTVALPCSVGAHPAFRWPLAEGCAKEDHEVSFERPETGPLLPVEGGLLGEPGPLPFDGKTLPLSQAVFAADALVMPDVTSRSVRFVARDGYGAARRTLTLSWEGYKDLGIWSKPAGADFLCIEPWYGMASPAAWQGEISQKPGTLLLAPGESRDFTWRATLQGQPSSVST